MKILTKKKQKKILQETTFLMIESIRNVDAEAMPIFSDKLTEIALIVGGCDAMKECVDKATKSVYKEGGSDD